MLKNKIRTKKWKYIAIVGLFLVFLTGCRVLWIISFQSTEQPYATNGQLDLRDWDIVEGRAITLDGEWEFYPHKWLFSEDNHSNQIQNDSQFIHVPGNWGIAPAKGKNTSFGYGSYRLRILVNPEKNSTYSIRVPSIRSSSELYVNGQLLEKSGQPGINVKETVAWNVPYSASFTANGNHVIEIVIQAANFKDPRDSGIIRSMKFGSENAIVRETHLSIAMQHLVSVVLLIHAIYALILFLMGNRERKLFYFSMVAISSVLIILLGGDDKLLQYWLPINYEWGFKLVHLAMVGFAYSLIQCVRDQLPVYWKKVIPAYAVICGIVALLTLLLSVQYMVMIQSLHSLLMFAAVLITMVSIIRTSIRDIKDNILLLLSLVALASNFMWWGIFLAEGTKIVYYPFDVIISTICFASVWFRHYFQVHSETKNLAAKLKSADKLKDEFLANTSHELRNPLHGILNISQAVLEREQHSISKKSVEDLGTVLSVGRRMSLMLNDLLDVMSLKEGVYQLNLRAFSIQTIATGVLDMLRFMTEGKPVQLNNRIPKDFPQIFADENRVIQILFNLLHNAVKFTDEGEVSIQAYVEDGKAHIVVVDTGIGMDEEATRSVFEPYEQAPRSQTMVEGGFGLGLSISKKLVELHGGSLWARSVLGQGSEFVFTLQLSDSITKSEEIEEVSLESFDFTASKLAAFSDVSGSISNQPSEILADRPRILVVDDDPVNLKVIETILSSEKYNITAVTSGKKALDVLSLQEWDLVISDVMMPQMSGYELASTIRKRFTITELPILLLTARIQTEDIKNGFLSGANDYVKKPVDALELESRVRALTDVKQSMRDRLQMEAAWLQAQIQPHFLFNTLNSVIALSEFDLDRMRNLLGAFSDFLRDKFKFQNMGELVPLEDELNVVRSYLFIEKERFGDRLNVMWEIDECKQLKIPFLIIQPLVENAVRHGIMKRLHGGNIHIRILDFENYVEISVIDDGVGMEEEALKRILVRQSNKKSGIGLLNTDLRLKRHYGNGLKIISKPGSGTSISFIVYKNNEYIKSIRPDKSE